MKPCIVIILLSAMFAASCGNEKKEAVQQTTVVDTAAVYDAMLTPNFYKRMEGTIADQQVVVQLQCYNGEIQGMYYYLNHGQWIMLNGPVNKNNPNNLSLIESNYSDGAKTATLECKYENGTLKGSWRSADGKKDYLIDLKENYPEGSYTFTTMSVKDSLVATQLKSAPVATVSKDFLIPLKDDEDGKWLSQQIKKALNIDSSLLPLDIVTGATRMNGKFLKSYRDDVKSMGNDDIAASLNYDDQEAMSVYYNDNGYVIFGTAMYSFTGGAHGNGGVSFNCLDVKSKKVLALKDIISADSAQLTPLVEAAFRKEQDLKPTDSLTSILFENHLEANENFYFTNKGIRFYYNPYEVSAYAVGPIEVFVSFESLRKYLNPEFVQRMKLQ